MTLLRRLHLYLGLGLLPWFLMYGISSLPFAHPDVTKALLVDGQPDWRMRIDRAYSLDFDPANLKPAGAQMIRDAGVAEAAFGVYRRPDGKIEVYRYTLRDATRLLYDPAGKRLTVEDRRFRWDYFLTGMHARGGFEHPGVLIWAWAVVIDLVCVGMLVWIVTGVAMWWTVPGRRSYGWVALGGGVLTFSVFVWLL